MSQIFKSIDRDMDYLLPPSVQDWLPQDHLARFVVEIVDQLDLTPIANKYRRGGSESYHPSVMIALLFYGYAVGIFSSRKIEKETYDSIAFRFIAANNHPDHDTIAHFRKSNLEEISALFVQILFLAKEMGFLKMGSISLDGTKIKANASKHKALSYEYALKLEKQIKEEVEDLLKRAEKADSEKSKEDLDIPKELQLRKDRLKAIASAKTEIERRAKERYNREKEEYDAKEKKRAEHEKATGKKAKGKKPTHPSQEPHSKDQVNLTDTESRIMPSKGGFEQAYNAQASVDLDSYLIVENHISQNSNDKKELEPAVEKISSISKELGMCCTALLADAGYCSEKNVQTSESHGLTPYISTHREKHNSWLKSHDQNVSVLEENASSVEKMRHRLQTPEGKKIYGRRKSTVETVFGIIKHAIGFRQFHLRGKASVEGEWSLVSMAWNIKRLHALAR